MCEAKFVSAHKTPHLKFFLCFFFFLFKDDSTAFRIRRSGITYSKDTYSRHGAPTTSYPEQTKHQHKRAVVQGTVDDAAPLAGGNHSVRVVHSTRCLVMGFTNVRSLRSINPGPRRRFAYSFLCCCSFVSFGSEIFSKIQGLPRRRYFDRHRRTRRFWLVTLNPVQH